MKKTLLKEKFFTKHEKQHSEQYYKWINILNNYSILWHILLSMFVVFLVELASRWSIPSALNFIVKTPLVFFYNSFIVFASLTLVYLFRRRAFARLILCSIWIIPGIINGIVLSNRVTPFGFADLTVISDLVTIIDTYLSPLMMDFEHLESILDERCKVLILSNPHNPAGIVWDKVTLQRLAEIATRHHLIVISDEIHADMALFGHKHTPFATVSDDAANCSITFGAPSKTFNIAGIVSSYTIVPNEVLREKFFSWLEANEMDMATIFAMTATEAAFNNGDDWRREMLRYVEQNIVLIEEFLAKELPQVKLLRPQASFLVWLDFSALGLQHDDLIDMLINRAHLALNDGKMFGPGGEQHARLNVGTHRAVLAQAMKQLKETIDNL